MPYFLQVQSRLASSAGPAAARQPPVTAELRRKSWALKSVLKGKVIKSSTLLNQHPLLQIQTHVFNIKPAFLLTFHSRSTQLLRISNGKHSLLCHPVQQLKVTAAGCTMLQELGRPQPGLPDNAVIGCADVCMMMFVVLFAGLQCSPPR
jgi:hypothetical protein